jgi:hypothetical protein
MRLFKASQIGLRLEIEISRLYFPGYEPGERAFPALSGAQQRSHLASPKRPVDLIYEFFSWYHAKKIVLKSRMSTSNIQYSANLSTDNLELKRHP